MKGFLSGVNLRKTTSVAIAGHTHEAFGVTEDGNAEQNERTMEEDPLISEKVNNKGRKYHMQTAGVRYAQSQVSASIVNSFFQANRPPVILRFELGHDQGCKTRARVQQITGCKTRARVAKQEQQPMARGATDHRDPYGRHVARVGGRKCFPTPYNANFLYHHC